MNWQLYEETVKDIYEKLGESSNIEILGWGPDCKVKGKSSVDHQIDVLTSYSDGVHLHRTAIECKYLSDKVSKDVVAKLSEIIEDAQIGKGVVVSKSGFTPDAVTFAKYKNIGLVELREPVDDDWQGRIRTIHINMHITAPEVYDHEFIWDDIGDQIEEINIKALTSDVLIHTPDGVSTSLHELTNSKPRNASREGEVDSYSVPFPAGTTLSFLASESKVPIREIRFKIRYEVATEEIEIRGEDHVFMIMRAIFENRRFVISPDGDIRESDPSPIEPGPGLSGSL